MSESSVSSRPRVRIEARLLESGASEVWDCNVYVDDQFVGGGTSPHGFLDIASDILYGDTNDRLNDYHGALGSLH
jgi:hypothetical protein